VDLRPGWCEEIHFLTSFVCRLFLMATKVNQRFLTHLTSASNL
jgi:hypothetical protein